MNESLLDFVRQSLKQIPTGKTQITIGTVSDIVASQLANETDIDIHHYEFTIDVFAVRHIFKSHGNTQKQGFLIKSFQSNSAI